MNYLNQSLAILQISLTNSRSQIGPVLVIVIGITCAVGVLVSMLAMGTGANRQAMLDVRDDRVIMRSIGAASATQSSIPKDVATAIRDLPGLRRSSQNQPIVVFDVAVPIEAHTRADATRIEFPLLGVSSGLLDLRPELHLTSGRMFQPGLNELIVGVECTREYRDFDVGGARSIRGAEWRIVGAFVQGHNAQCIVYADAGSVMSTFGLSDYNEVAAMLNSNQAYGEVVTAIRVSPTIRVDVKPERELVAKEYSGMIAILNFSSYFVGAIMAIGATLGAVNSLYVIIDGRRRELATLRAIGYTSGPIASAILAESIVLALPGALLGSILAWLFFDGLAASPFGFSFHLAVTPPLVLVGVLWALLMGLAGGLLPALRAARTPVAAALRSA